MSLRSTHRALTRTAVPAAPHAALILGGLLLLTCPWGPAGRLVPGHSGGWL